MILLAAVWLEGRVTVTKTGSDSLPQQETLDEGRAKLCSDSSSYLNLEESASDSRAMLRSEAYETAAQPR